MMWLNTCFLNTIAVLCESKILVLPDFKPVSNPGDDYKVIQFVESAPTKQGIQSGYFEVNFYF